MIRVAVRLLAAALANRSVLTLGGVLAAACIWQAGIEGLDWTWPDLWNDVRLSRAYAAVGGADLYAGPDEGVLPGHLYGPVGFYLYAPVRLASTPGAAIRLGVALAALMVLIPFAWTLYRTGRGFGDRLWFALFLLAAFHFYWSPTAGGLWMTHVDAPAVALALVSGYALLRTVETDRAAWAITTAAAGAAAVWAKQTMAPVLVLPAVYLWFSGKRREAWLTFGCTGLFGATLGLIFGWLYGFHDLWFTMFEIPSRHDRFFGLLLFDYTLFESWLDLLPLLAILLFAGSTEIPRPAIVAALYSATLFPFAALGRLKVSGSPNNYLAPDVFWTLALSLAAAGAVGQASPQMRRRASAVLGLALLLQMGRTAHFLLHDAYQRYTNPQVSATDEAYRFLLRHPGAAYFPWNPLATQMAEGRLTDSGHGVLTRRQAGYPVGDAQWRSHTPGGAAFLVTPGEPNTYLLDQMPEFHFRTEHPDLSDNWVVYRTAEVPDPSPVPAAVR